VEHEQARCVGVGSVLLARLPPGPEGRYLRARTSRAPACADCHLGLGTLYRRTGKREQAQEHLTTATAMYRQMGMRFWLENAEAEMKELLSDGRAPSA
jgi:hypothetical protein